MHQNNEPKAQSINIPGLKIQSPSTINNLSEINGLDTLAETGQVIKGDATGSPTLTSPVNDNSSAQLTLGSNVGNTPLEGQSESSPPKKIVDLTSLNTVNPLEQDQSLIQKTNPEHDNFNRIKRILASTIPPKEHDDRIHENNKNYIASRYKIGSKLNESDFKDLDWIIYQTVKYFSDIEGILTKPLLAQYLFQYSDKLLRSTLVDVKRILQHKGLYIDLSIESGYEQAKAEVIPMILEYFDELQQLEVSSEEFNSQLALYSDYLFSQHQERLLKEALIIKSRGMEVYLRGEKKFLYGAIDADEHYSRNIQYYKLKYLRDETNKVFDTSKGVSQLKELKRELKETFKVIATLGVTKVDKMFKGFRPTKCLGIEGGASSGKTRLSRGITYRALVDYKQNVLDITMEQPRAEIVYIYVATHLMAKYNIYIPDNKILADELTDVERQVVNLAELDLIENPEYGKLRIESRNMNIEDAIQELKAIKHTELDYGVCLVDYVGLIGSKDLDKYGTTDKFQIITTFYQRFKREICVELNVFGILLNQLAKDGVTALAKGGETTTYDGSGSGETYKTPDYNIVCFQNEQLRDAKQIQLTFPKVRLGQKSAAVYASTPMGAAIFRDVVNKSDKLDEALQHSEDDLEEAEVV